MKWLRQCTIRIWCTLGSLRSPHAAFTGDQQCWPSGLGASHLAHSGELCDIAPLISAALSARRASTTGWYLSVFVGHAVWSSEQVACPQSVSHLYSSAHCCTQLMGEVARGCWAICQDTVRFLAHSFFMLTFIKNGQTFCSCRVLRVGSSLTKQVAVLCGRRSGMSIKTN